jgi:protein tyrosine phosphatase
MPAYNKMPEVISATCKILVTGLKANELAIREFIKAEIKKALSEKPLSPDEFEKQLASLVKDRLYAYSRTSIIGAEFKHCIDYARSAYQDVDTAIEAYSEACATLRLTPELKKEIKTKILTAKKAAENKSLLDTDNMDELLGQLLRRIRHKRISSNSAIKTYYLLINEADLKLEYYQAQISLLSSQKLIELDEKVPSNPTIEDLSTLHEFFCDLIESQYVAKFKEEIRQEMQHVTPIPNIHPHWQYLYYKDDCFPLYCANWIRGSNFIAMSGPQDSVSLAVAMHSLLFSDSMKDKPPVTIIIALGNCVGANRIDFFNSYYDETNPSCKMTSSKSFIVPSHDNEDAENPLVDYNYQINIKNTHVSNLDNSNTGFITSKLDVSGKKLNALLIGLPDGNSLDLDIDSPETQKLKKLFWKISQKSLTEGVAVHCAAGVGRTGHVILMLEILKNYQRIFSRDNSPDAIAKEIQIIVNRMRETRPALIYALEQYLTAIKNADILYQYALEKKYITEPATLSTMSFLAPEPVPSTPTESKEACEQKFLDKSNKPAL